MASWTRFRPLPRRGRSRADWFEFLTPLLDEAEDRAVRFAAASYLFHHGHQDAAVPALEAIRNGSGLESITARVILDKWRGRV